MIQLLLSIALSLQAIADKAAAANNFSGVVVLAKDNQPILERAYGVADPATKAPNRIDTKFNLGSINKIFTQVAIAQLAQAGKLSLDDTVRKHIPDYPSPAADKITIQQLVDFRSGLGDFFGPEFLAAPPAKVRTLSDYLALFANKPLLFEPGTEQRYSNAGYIVLGLIVERASGQSYYDYVREHIYKPAGMRDTEAYAIDEKVPNRAVGLTTRGGDGISERHPNLAQMPGRGSSAGGGYSTAPDLLRFAKALTSNKLVDAKWTDWVFKGKEHNLGVAGGAPGVNSTLLIEPPYTLVVLSNYDPPAAEEIARAARPLLGGKPPQRSHDEEPDEVLITGPVNMPFTLAQHVPVIEAKINGKGPFRFGFDTGFGGMVEVNPKVAAQLGMPVVGEAMSGDPSGRAPLRIPMHRAESVDVGTIHFGGVTVGENARTVLGDVDGMIGLSLFRGFLVTFDYPNGRVKIGGGKLPDDALAYSIDHGVPAIDILVNGKSQRVHLDSGSPALVTLPRSAAASLTLAEEPRVVGHGRTADGEFDVYSAPLNGEVRIGSIALANPRLDFIDVFPIGNLGYRFFKDLTIVFDPASRRVKFVK